MSTFSPLAERQLRGSLVMLLAVVAVILVKIAAGPLPVPFFSASPALSEQTVSTSTIQVDMAGTGGGIYFFEGGVTVRDVLAAVAPRQMKLFQTHAVGERLSHGDRLVVTLNPPSIRRERMESRVMVALGMPLDINGVGVEDLVMIPGVGPVTATAIVRHREERGRFKAMDDLIAVRGIGEKRLQGLKRYLTLDTGQAR
ncbi:MAG: helix-hairpin-helix domain-containing protein [Syntrophales bacterium]|jgi:competence protein ComEA|nr:helix-hairpin-helix domain-containing protein [Syntrophales bacterium]MCK9527974.1 helix-hairpin-helix domain-containing protein [Syntrophales bacterium]MDX9921450.1 helix-hairpin-helix domain-containing protein [Syntrophales bacterium]